jgi:phage terminase large subunit GpA-like protein
MEMAEYLRARRPVKIGFHIPSWLSRFVSLSSPASSYLRGLTDINKFKDFYNKHMAEPWKLIVTSKNEEQVLAARCELPPQTVPEAAIALTLGVDSQKYGNWFAVRAWAPDLTSWLIHYGFVQTDDDLDLLLYETSYPVEGSDRTMRVFRALRDTGGSEVYYWLVKNRGRGGVALWGSKGSSSNMPGMLSVGNAIISTPSGKKLPDVLRLIMVNTDKAKDQYHYRLQLASKDETRSLPGAAFLHADTGVDYAAQILAEQKQLNDKGHEEWVNVHQRPNHLLDADLLAMACVEMEFPGGGLRLLAPHLQKKPETRSRPQNIDSDGDRGSRPRTNFSRPSWMNRR